jgi:5-methylcytosine-specific restriction endonuclease McrA
MPNAPPHVCSRCRRIVVGRCPRCTQRRDHERGTAAARGYTADWSAYARDWLARFPWCGQRMDGRFYPIHSHCTQRGERVRARVVDHIHALRDGGARLDPVNHQSLCASCNRRKG